MTQAQRSIHHTAISFLGVQPALPYLFVSCQYLRALCKLVQMWCGGSAGNRVNWTEWMEDFRVDMYGNVVSIHASDGALCKFDVDHIFPWSRGGRSGTALVVFTPYTLQPAVSTFRLTLFFLRPQPSLQ